MRYNPIPSSLFSDRRKAFRRQMQSSSIAIFYSNDPKYRSADQHYPFRQDPSLFAMSGIDQPGTILVLMRGSKQKKSAELLFILDNDPKNEIWNGKRLSKKEASQISAIHHVQLTDQWNDFVEKTLPLAKTIYVNFPLDKDIRKQTSQGHMATMLRKKIPNVTIESTEQIYRHQAMIKHPHEIALLEKAIAITAEAFEQTLRHLKPGMKEYEIEAGLFYSILKRGGRHAFEPIVASGISACTLHYTANDRTIKPGTLVLIDFGAEYSNMASDMTRTIPADGKFTREQKKIYLSVLRMLNAVTDLMRPGILLKDLNQEAGKMIESELIGLKILSRSDIKRQDPKKPLWKKYFMHGISHHLGYDVHDPADRESPLAPGMVLTCEPGLYLPHLKLGIRLENDILITKNGSRNLMASVPVEPEEIESIMLSGT